MRRSRHRRYQEQQRNGRPYHSWLPRASGRRIEILKRQQLTSKKPTKGPAGPSTSEASAREALACGVGSHKRGAARSHIEAVGAAKWRRRIAATAGPMKAGQWVPCRGCRAAVSGGVGRDNQGGEGYAPFLPIACQRTPCCQRGRQASPSGGRFCQLLWDRCSSVQWVPPILLVHRHPRDRGYGKECQRLKLVVALPTLRTIGYPCLLWEEMGLH
jgi:hypothetical protein